MPPWQCSSTPHTSSLHFPLLLAYLAILATLAARSQAQCVRRLPTVDNPSNATSLNSSATALPTPPTRFILPISSRIPPRLFNPILTQPSVRIVNGLAASQEDKENIVTIGALDELNRPLYICAGSLIAPQWVLTAAQCSVTPRNNFINVAGDHALHGDRYEIVEAIVHEGSTNPNGPHRDDIQLIKLSQPIKQAVRTPVPRPSPPESPPPDPSTVPGAPTAPSPDPSSSSSPLPSPSPVEYNLMRINTNKDFAIPPAAARYLRVKGYGLTARPEDNEENLIAPRPLRYADVKTAGCGGNLGSDHKRRICTAPDRKCGPCFGDTGGPLFDVDGSGKVGVLVGILTFGRDSAFDKVNPACTDKKNLVEYTAVAPYVDWIKKNIGNETALFYNLPPTGISNTRLAPEPDSFPAIARTSLIVVSSLALIAALTALFVTCILRHLRRRRRRWIEGLHAEDSFVKAEEKHAAILDPFEGIVDDQRQNRPSISGLSRAAINGATEFSARSISKLKALIKRVEEEEEAAQDITRLPMDDAPNWLNGAWDRLFRPPSRQDVDSIHRIATQRVVDDVLEGADKIVEPSLDSVAYKAARDELNLQLAWQRLEIKTSLRNMSESSVAQEASIGSDAVGPTSSTLAGVSGNNYTAGPSSPPPPPSLRRWGSRNSSRNVSQNVSRNVSRHQTPISPPSGTSSSHPLQSSGRRAQDVGKADALLAAFAVIDAESENVAEETVIDSSALRALAAAKRPNLLEALRRKFSAGAPGQSEGREDRVVDSEDGVRSGMSWARGANGSGIRSGTITPDSAVRMSPRSRMSPATSATIGRSLSRRVSSSAGGSPAMLSRQSSMHMDYFSREYELSGSESETDEGEMEEDEKRSVDESMEATDGERTVDDMSGLTRRLGGGESGRASRISFEKMVWGNERKLEDRVDGMDARYIASRSSKLSHVRSFESLERKRTARSSDGGESMEGSGVLHAPQPGRLEVLPEGTDVEKSAGAKAQGGSASGSGSGSSTLLAQTIMERDVSNGGDGQGGESEKEVSVASLKHMWSELGRRDGMFR